MEVPVMQHTFVNSDTAPELSQYHISYTRCVLVTRFPSGCSSGVLFRLRSCYGSLPSQQRPELLPGWVYIRPQPFPLPVLLCACPPSGIWRYGHSNGCRGPEQHPSPPPHIHLCLSSGKEPEKSRGVHRWGVKRSARAVRLFGRVAVEPHAL